MPFFLLLSRAFSVANCWLLCKPVSQLALHQPSLVPLNETLTRMLRDFPWNLRFHSRRIEETPDRFHTSRSLRIP